MLERLSIRVRIIGAFSFLIALTLILGFVSLTRLNNIAESGRLIGTNAMPSVVEASNLYINMLRYRTNQFQHLLSQDPAHAKTIDERMALASKGISDARQAYEPLISSSEERAVYDELIGAWASYLSDWQQAYALARQADAEAANAMMENKLTPKFRQIQDLTDKLIAINDSAADQAIIGIEATGSRSLIEMGTLLAVSISLALAAIWVMIQKVVRPILGLTSTMDRLAHQDLAVAVAGTDRMDELGAMARSVQVFKEGLIKADQLARAQEAERITKEQRAARIDQLVREFDEHSGAALRTVGAAATELDATAQSMAAIAEETSRQAMAASAAAEQTTANVQTVAAAAEEMAASIAEITHQVSRSKHISDQATQEVEKTDATVNGLSEAAARIGAVVQLIQDIAGQTNLLALNATIEAARAGEAGKGFAVVASEVKALANQTAKATEEIATQVNAVQQATGSSVSAIRSIGATIQSVSEIGTSIAVAMEQQGASTTEISRNVTQAATGTQDVSANVAQVTEAASQTGSAAGQVLSAARELSQQSELLREQVEKFLADIRTA